MKPQIIPTRTVILDIRRLVDNLTPDDLIRCLDAYQRALMEEFEDDLYAMGGDAKRHLLFLVFASQEATLRFIDQAEDDLNRLLAFFSVPRREVRPASSKFPDLIAKLQQLGYQVDQEEDEPEEV